MEAFLLIVTVFALIGAYLNSMGRIESFMIWILTNFVFMINNWMIGQWQQSLLFGCYFAIALNGLFNFNKK